MYSIITQKCFIAVHKTDQGTQRPVKRRKAIVQKNVIEIKITAKNCLDKQ